MAKRKSRKKKPHVRRGQFVRELIRHERAMKGFERRIKALKDKGVLKIFEDGRVKASLIAEREARRVSLPDELGITGMYPINLARARRRLRRLQQALLPMGITVRCGHEGSGAANVSFFAR